MSAQSDLEPRPEQEGATVMIILVIAVRLEVDEAIAVIAGQVGALDRQFAMVGQRRADRGMEVERAALTSDRKSVGRGKSVYVGIVICGSSSIKKKKQKTKNKQ